MKKGVGRLWRPLELSLLCFLGIGFFGVGLSAKGRLTVKLTEPSSGLLLQHTVFDLERLDLSRDPQVVATALHQSTGVVFPDLEPGTYRVRIHQPTGYVHSVHVDLSDGEGLTFFSHVHEPASPMVSYFSAQSDLGAGSIRSVVETDQGQLFAASLSGLHTYTPERWENLSIVPRNVHDIAITDQGLLLTTPKGVYHYLGRGELERLPLFDPVAGSRCAWRGSDGAAMIAGGVSLGHHKNTSWVRGYLPHGEKDFLDVAALPARSFRLLNPRGVWRWDEPTRRLLLEFAPDGLAFSAICSDQAHGRFLAVATDRQTRSSFLYSCVEGGAWSVEMQLPYFPDLKPQSLSECDGFVYLMANNGVFKIKDRQARFLPVPGPKGAYPWTLRSVSVSRTGSIWLAADEGIAAILDRQVLRHGPTNGLLGGAPRRVELDDNGQAWVLSASHLSVAQKFEVEERWRSFPIQKIAQPTDPAELKLITHGGLAYFASNDGLWQSDGRSVIRPSDLPERLRAGPLQGMGLSGEGLWFGGSGSFYRFDPETRQWSDGIEVPAEQLAGAIRHMWIDPLGTYWASDGTQLLAKKHGRWERKALAGFAASGDLLAPPVYADERVCTPTSTGIHVLEADRATPNRTAKLLVNHLRYVRGIGWILSSNNGMSVVRNEARWRVNQTHGLPSGIVYDATFDGDKFWLCTAQGVVTLSPSPLASGRSPSVNMLTQTPVATYPLSFSVEARGASPLQILPRHWVALLHHTHGDPESYSGWNHVEHMRNIQAVSGRTGLHHLHVLAEDIMGNRSEPKVLDFKIASSPAQNQRVFRNRTAILLTFGILFTFMWAWWRGRRLLDRAEQARLEADRLAVEARLANEAKTRFLANVSHELRTPLTTVIGHGDLLALHGGITPKARDSIRSIQHGGQHLLAVVNDVIDLAHLEIGKKRFEPEFFSPSNLIREVGENLERRGERTGKTVQLDLETPLPEQIYLDPIALRRVLFNLGKRCLDQAAKRVSIRAWKLPETSDSPRGRLRFVLSNDGPPIPFPERNRLFEPFTSAKRSRDAGHPIMLALAKALVEAMHGEIGLSESPAERGGQAGPAFWFEIPLAPIPVHLWPLRSAPMHAEVAPRQRVLLVEDEDHNRHLFEKILEPLLLDIRSAADGRETLACLDGWMPELVLMDFRLPDTNGHKLATTIRELPGGEKVWITCLSADVYGIQDAYPDAPFDDYLDKPIRIKAILAYVEAALSRLQVDQPS